MKLLGCYVLSSMVKFGSINYRQRGVGAPTGACSVWPELVSFSPEGSGDVGHSGVVVSGFKDPCGVSHTRQNCSRVVQDGSRRSKHVENPPRAR